MKKTGEDLAKAIAVMLFGFLIVGCFAALVSGNSGNDGILIGIFFAIVYLTGVVAFMGFRILSLLKQNSDKK